MALSNHTASMYFCVVVSKESPCWAYSSLVNANTVCACVLIMSWSQRRVLSHRGIVSDQEATGQVRWEQITVGRREMEGFRYRAKRRGWKQRERRREGENKTRTRGDFGFSLFLFLNRTQTRSAEILSWKQPKSGGAQAGPLICFRFVII